MLSLHDHSYRLCDGLSRRDWLRLGAVSALGLGMNGRPAPAATSARAKACIFLYLVGGPPQHETWDPKPDAPAEIKGDLKPIATSLPGYFVGELMPRTARLMDKICVLRAISTNDHSHSSSMYWTLTGHAHQPTNTETTREGAPNDAPCLGSLLGHLRQGRGSLPAAITLPEQVIGNNLVVPPGQNAGFLGRKADPWLLTCDPSAPDFRVPALELQPDVSTLRVHDRTALLDQVNQHFAAADRGGAPGLQDARRRQAFDLLCSTKARQAFDLDREPAGVRERYGRHKFGQSCLLARRLVEAGVSLVHINWPREKGDMQTGNPLWDTHSNNTQRLKNNLMPPWDIAYSALLEDLAARGMLDDTLVVCLAEFGRTPKLNSSAGRDHWGGVFSASLAGGGIRGSRVLGASDRIGSGPKDGRVVPDDIAATIFHCLGYGPDHEVKDAVGRPLPLSRGQVIRQAL